MTEEKMILNDGQYDLGMITREVSVSVDVLADKGWHKLADDEQVVKKVELTKEETDWFEKHKGLPFFKNDSTEHFTKKVFDYSVIREDRERCYNLFSQAYFNGYTIKKEKKYYIKLGFNGDDNNLKVDHEDGVWYWGSEITIPLVQYQYTQTEIDEMQKDPQARGLDLNELKVEVPEYELED